MRPYTFDVLPGSLHVTQCLSLVQRATPGFLAGIHNLDGIQFRDPFQITQRYYSVEINRVQSCYSTFEGIHTSSADDHGGQQHGANQYGEAHPDSQSLHHLQSS
jgi:hypothetical protein